MKPDEIRPGGYYVMRHSGAIRHFFAITPRGKALYRAYDPQSGEYIQTCTCTTEFLVHQAERSPTTEEISRLHEWKPESDYHSSALGKALKGTGHRRR